VAADHSQEHVVAKTFHCSIVTPVASIFEGELVYASIPAWDGQFGMMPGESPLLAKLGSGTLRLDFPPPDGSSRWFMIDGGFAQVQGDNLTLLTEGAIPAETISLHEAEAELAEANARVTKPGEDRTKVERDQARALAKVTLARSAKARGGAI
jgi:F-type H+-transporting ATPase subunit epsilon